MTNVNARKVAVDVLVRVENEGAYSHIALREAFGENPLEARDKGLVTELVYGTIRNKATLDHVVNSFLKKRDLKPEIRSILRMGVYQLLYMNKIPVSAAVNESVKLVHLYRMNSQKGLVNAVLRNVDRSRGKDYFGEITDPVEKLAVTASHPVWLVKLYIKRYGIEQATELLNYNNAPGSNVTRVNTLKTTTSQLRRELESSDVQVGTGPAPDTLVLKSKRSLPELEAYRKGYFMLQSPSSILAALAVGARPGERILDCCAAPGGKSFILAQEMENQGRLLATDVHEHKMELIAKGADFLGITCLETQVRDWTREQTDLLETFDRVLVDAPCTGLGVLSKRPDARWRKTEEDISLMAALQKKILTRAQEAVKPGGILLYSTCTLTEEENQQQRQWFLEHFPEFQPSPLQMASPAFDKEDQRSLEQGELEITPFKHGLEGFYIAGFRRQESQK